MEDVSDSPSDPVLGEMGKTLSRELESNTDGGIITGKDHSSPSSLKDSSPPPFTATASVQPNLGNQLVAVKSELSSIRPQHYLPVEVSPPGKTTETKPHGSSKADRGECGGGGDGAFDAPGQPSSTVVDERIAVQRATTNAVTTPSEKLVNTATANGNEKGVEISSGLNGIPAAFVATLDKMLPTETVGVVGREGEHGGSTGALSSPAPMMEGEIPTQPAPVALNLDAQTGVRGTVGSVSVLMPAMDKVFNPDRVADVIGAGGSDPPALAATSAPSASIEAPSPSDPADAQPVPIAAPRDPTPIIASRAEAAGVVQGGDNAQSCAATSPRERGEVVRQSASGGEGQQRCSSVDMGIAGEEGHSADTQICAVLQRQEQAAAATAAEKPKSSKPWMLDGGLGLEHRVGFVAQGQDDPQKSMGGTLSLTEQPANHLPGSSGGVDGTSVADVEAMPSAVAAVSAATEAGSTFVEELVSQEANPGGRVRDGVVAELVSAATGNQPGSVKELLSPAAELGGQVGEEEMAGSVSDLATSICSAQQPTPEFPDTRNCPGENVHHDSGSTSATAVAAWAFHSADSAADTLAPAPGAVASSVVAPPGQGNTGREDDRPVSSGGMDASATAATESEPGSMKGSNSLELDETVVSQDTMETRGGVWSFPGRSVFEQEPAMNTKPLRGCLSGEPDTFDTMDIARAALLYANAAAATTAPVTDSSNGPTAAAEHKPSNGHDGSISNNFSGSRMPSLGEASQAVAVPPAASSALTAAPAAAKVVRDTGRQPPSSAGSSRVSTTSRKGSNSSRARKHRDMMHIMCMICLEKLSDAAEGGGAKLLGLLDSCTHRYCYTCILEWSKVTNKCPQCKSRFHTIKAVKELRKNNDRYRGLAVSVEDRDQTYNFVDLRDVAVLDPDVGCHSACLLRGAIDAFQRGWEFSVQCEQCSNWFHGVCVGFREEQAVPDRWFCRPCRGEAYETVHVPDAATVVTPATAAAAPALGARGGRASSARGRVRGRGQGGFQSHTNGQDHLAPPVPGQGRDGGRFVRGRGQAPAESDVGDAECNDGARDLSRIAIGGRRANSRGAAAATPAPSPTLLPPSISEQSPSTAAVAVVPARGRRRRSRTPPLPSSLPSVQPLAPRVTRSSASPPSAPPSPPLLSQEQPQEQPQPQPQEQPQEQPQQEQPQEQEQEQPQEQQEQQQQPQRQEQQEQPQQQEQPGEEQLPLSDVAQSEVQLNLSMAGGESSEVDCAQVVSGAPRSASARTAANDSAGDGHHGLPQPPAQSLRRALEVSEATDLCDICGFDTETDNLIVYCESCNMGVHQTCYGISEIPKKEWYCSPCSNGVRPSTLACKFCPVKGGALKRCTDGEWGHILCAFWIPECCFMNPRNMEPIGSINKRGQAGPVELYLPSFRVRKCYICGTSDGCTIRCHTSACRFHLHPMCGSKAGSVYMEIETSMKTGADGKEYETVKLVARCPKHNKNSTGVGRNRKTRAALPSAADPLRVFGKAIEIADPARDGAVVLGGKVTWFDSVRSKYCVVEYMHDRSERDGSSSRGSGSVGGGDAKGWAHWIAVDKLVEAKAVGIERNGTRFALESRLLLEEGEEDGGVVEQNVSETTTAESDAQDSARVKMEEEEDAGMEGGGESVVSSSVGEGTNREEKTEQVDSTGGQKEREEDMHLEENVASRKGESRMRTRRTTIPPAAQEPDPFPQQEPEKEVVQEASQWPPAQDSPLEESGGAFRVGQNSGPGRSENGDTATTSIEDANSQPTTKRAAQHSHRSDLLLPSVQCPETSDPSARYPTRRGRRRRAPSPALDRTARIILEGVSSLTKKPRLENTDIGGPAGADATVAEPTSAPPSPGGGGDTVSGGDTLSVVAVFTPVDANKGTSSPRQSPQEALSPVGRELGASSEVSEESFVEPVAERATELAYGLEAGWPYGMEMLGQVPVMRVRSLPISDGDDVGFKATYFSSAYAGATKEISSTDKRSARSRLSFRFEAIEELNTPHLLGEGTLQRESRSAESFEAPLQSCADQLGGTHKRERAEEHARDDAKGYAYADGNIHDSERSGAQDEQEEEEEIEPAGERENVVILVRDTMPPSPRSSEEFSDSMEDGEMKRLPDGRADIMPPSPRDEDMEEDMAWDNGNQVAEEAGESTASQGPDHRPEDALHGDGGQENAADAAEDMDISSDVQSFGSPEGAETASSCSSDEEIMYDVGTDLGYCDSAATAAAALDTAATASSSPVNEGAVATPSPAVAGNYPLQLQAPAGDSDNSKSSSASAASQLVSAGAGQDEMATPGEVVSLEPPPSAPVPVRERPEVLALRRIVREQLQDILRSASKDREAALSSGDGNAVLGKIAADVEEELFGRLYKDTSGGRPYKAKYKQLLLSLGNVRNYRLVASVVAGTTTPIDLATKDAVGLLNSLTSSLNCLAIPLTGRHKPSSVGERGGNGGKLKRRGRMMLL